MTQARIGLSLVIHNHQPVGNFGFVFEDNHRLAYAPMLHALERHPRVRVGLHYTGPLLEWLKAERQDTVASLRRLVEHEQVEILGGGYYEPVLASLPDRDRLGQLTRMADEVEATFGARPRGAWLAERVWEPDLPVALVDAGYDYTILDDAHLRAAAIPDERHWHTYATDDQGRRLLVFGTEQGLRYRIPFRPVDETIAHLRRHATTDGRRIGMMGDDGEKFGAWPGTWDLCWGEHAWVERFLTALEENADWLTTLRPSDALERFRPIGRAYVPTGSYAEMGEWALPVTERSEYTRLLHQAQADGRPEARWMRGGFWRNFAVNYREINDLHKQMLRTSAAVDGVPVDDPRRVRIRDHLYRGQSNDCYWHGLFGGIYLSHMRLATAAHLIAAEDAADRTRNRSSIPGVSVQQADIDLDGFDELLIRTPGQVLGLSPERGGGIVEWDVRAVRHALTSVMRRRPEAYHESLRALESGALDTADQGAVSIHDLVTTTEPGLARRLWFDEHDRSSGLVRFLAADASLEALEHAEDLELGDFLASPYKVAAVKGRRVELRRDGSVREADGAPVPMTVRKTIRVGPERRKPAVTLSLAVTNEGDTTVEARLALEWSLNMLGGGGNPAAWIEAEGERHRFDTRGEARGVSEVAMGNDDVGVTLRQRATPAADAWWFSIETISLSEQGFERNHQGTCLLWSWPLRLDPGESMTVDVDTRIDTSVDRAEEEGL